MNIKIPKSFQLFGQTITVHFVPHLASENGNIGEARLGENKIYLQDNVEGRKMSKEQIEWVFLHELTHMIFSHMGEDELTQNEILVDNFSRLLHQSLKTMKYKD